MLWALPSWFFILFERVSANCRSVSVSSSMASTFAGCSTHDIVGSLKKSEVRAALLQYPINWSCFRTCSGIQLKK